MKSQNDVVPPSTPPVQPQAQFVTIAEEEAGQRIDNYLLRVCKGVPKSHIYRILRSGEVRVNKGRIDQLYRLAAGDMVRIPPVRVAEKAATGAPAAEFKIIFEDAQLLVIDKPAGVAVHGGSGVSFGVIEQLRASRPDAKFLELVHRLDRDTSGCVLVAKTKEAQRYYTEQFQNGGVTKTYAALVKGQPPKLEGTIEAPIGKDPARPNRRRITPCGKPARTHYQVVDVTEATTSNEATPVVPVLSKAVLTALKTYDGALVYCQIPTGRTHQIRLHMKSIGCPVLGDTMYGQAAPPFKRQCLHALRLTFVPYGQKEPVTVTSPLPNNFGINC